MKSSLENFVSKALVSEVILEKFNVRARCG